MIPPLCKKLLYLW